MEKYHKVGYNKVTVSFLLVQTHCKIWDHTVVLFMLLWWDHQETAPSKLDFILNSNNMFYWLLQIVTRFTTLPVSVCCVHNLIVFIFILRLVVSVKPVEPDHVLLDVYYVEHTAITCRTAALKYLLIHCLPRQTLKVILLLLDNWDHNRNRTLDHVLYYWYHILRLGVHNPFGSLHPP